MNLTINKNGICHQVNTGFGPVNVNSEMEDAVEELMFSQMMDSIITCSSKKYGSC